MANQHPSHPAPSHSSSGLDDGRAARARLSLTGAASRARHRLGGVLRCDEADGVERLLRRGVALSMAMLLGLWPVMGTAIAAERTAAAAERTDVAALAPIRMPLEVAPPAFTLVTAGAAAHLEHDGAEVRVPPGALAVGGTLSIRPLAAREVAKLPPGLLNTTRGPRRGYRMEPSGHFNGQVTVTLPYDRHLLPEGMPDRNVRIFWYDTEKKHWTPLRHVEVNAQEQTVTGWTGHFTDFITGVVNVPNHQQVEGYTPTKFSGMKAADPGAKVNLIEPPQASSTGDANVSYPIEVPPGRNGLLPSLAVTYNSSRGNGWLGTGWGLDIPSVDIDTRWGVPRYDTGQIDPSRGPLETETYMLNGAELAPVANRGDLQPRRTTPTNPGDCTAPCATFSHRVEGDFSKIVRHGDNPTNYWWEVTAKDGTRSLFGGSVSSGSPSGGFDSTAVLRDPNSPNGNVGRWMLREVIDTNGNNIKFYYDIVDVTSNGPELAREIYPFKIFYTGRAGAADGPYEVCFTRDNGNQGVASPQRPDPIVDGRLGFKTVEADRLIRVDVMLLPSTPTPTSPCATDMGVNNIHAVRSYTLDYGLPGQFNKSLLRTLAQVGADGITTFNQHSFTYFDEIGGTGTFDPGTALNAFGAQGSGTVPGGTGALTSGSNLAGDVKGTAFSGEGDASDQTHLYLGIALGPFKNLSAGAKLGAISDSSQMSAILIDLNGDGLLDQVFVNGNTVSWVKNTGTPGAPSFSTTAQPVAGLSAIERSTGFTFTAGPEVYAGADGLGVTGLYDTSWGQTNNSLYFSDVNGDGLPDVVTTGGAVLFNQGVDSNGNPFFAAMSPTPLGGATPAASPKTAGLIQPPSDPMLAATRQTAAQQAFAVVDSLRRWVAPFTGTINVTGQVALTQAPPQNDTGVADGVRAAVQLEDSELFSVTISDPTDLTPKPITGLTGIPVTIGQRLYFRVNSRNDGAFDTVSFDPTITYTAVNNAAVDPATLDESGLPVYVFTASTDFAFGGRPMTVTVPVTGTATITGMIVKPNVTTDDVNFVITQNGVPVFAQTIAAAAVTPAGGVPIVLPPSSSPLTLNQNDQIVARITSDTRVNLSGILFTPLLAYQTINGNPAATAADGTPQLTQLLPATAQVFGVSVAGAPQTAFIAPGGPVEVTQTVSSIPPAVLGLNGSITLAAKSGGVVLGKQVVSIVNGVITGPATLDVTFNLPAGTQVFFTAEVSSADILRAFTVSAPTDTAGNVLPSDTRVDTSATDPFAGGYRNWWYGDYTPADADGTAPIDQTVLRFPVPQGPTSTTQDPVLGRFVGALPNEAGTPAVQILTNNPPPLQPENPPQILPRWAARSGNAFTAGGLMGSTRLGNRVPAAVSDGTGFGGATGVVKTGSSTNVAASATFSMGLSFGVGTSNGTAGSDIDFLDFNGDGYPDVVGSTSIQPTLPNGVLGGQTIGLTRQLTGDTSQIRQNANGSFNVTLGATTSNQRFDANGFPLGIFSEQASYNISFGGSVQASWGKTGLNYDLIDVNGDGLPDLVQPGPDGIIVQLNLGYRFGAQELWSASGGYPGRVRQTQNTSFGASADISAGTTDGVYGFGGGGSSTQSQNASDYDLIDVNGDGLPDLVTKCLDNSDGSINVSPNCPAFDPTFTPPFNDLTNVASKSTVVLVNLNSGAGFLPRQQWTGALPSPILSRSSVNRDLGLHFTISFPLPTIFAGVPLFFITNPGFYHGDAFGGSRSQVRDLDGDGYADHISAAGAAVTVNLNKRGKTNLLKSITRPLGATITLDYTRAGNTTDLPQNHWVMSSRTVDDGVGVALAGDAATLTANGVTEAAHTQLSTFAYQNGKWDRAERTFFGFATVTEQQLDTAQAGQPVIRSIIETFRTDSLYTKGLLAQSVTQDGAGRRFLETDNTYNVVTVNNHTGVAGLENFTETRFPQLVQRNKLFFEGQPTAGEQTTETFAYDDCTSSTTPCFGNVISYADFGDVGTADDVFSTIGYTASNPACVASYIVGIANSVTVTDASGNLLRERQSDVGCTPGNGTTGNVTENRRFLSANGPIAVTDMTYDGEGKLTSVTGPANLNNQRYSLAYTYDTTVDVYVESVTDSFGDVSNSTHDFKFGALASSTDENGQVITNSYDNFGRLTHVTGPYQQVATGKPTTIDITYPDTLVPPPPAPPPAPPLPIPSAKTSHIDTLLDPQLAAGTNHIETVLFTDGLKRILQTKKEASAVDPPPATGGAVSAPAHVMTVSGRVAFDALGRTIAQFYPVTDAISNDRTFTPAFDTVRPTKTAYDILDRVTQIQIPDDIVALNTGYDTATTTYDFGADRFGQTRFRTTMIDFNGKKSEQYRDVRAQIVTVNEFNNNAATVFHTSYAYDPVRQITGVTDDQGNVTSVAYDLFGRRTAINSPDAGRTTFSYDLADNLTAKQTANLRAAGGLQGQQVTFGYQFNRVTSITYPNFPGNNVTYTYGAAAQRAPSLVGNVVGRITHIADGAGTEDLQYGPLGEMVVQTRSIPIQGGQVLTYTTQFTYDTWNRVQQMIYPDQGAGETVKYTYDFGGLPYRVHGNDDQLEVDYASNLFYDKFGGRLQMVYGNGAITTYGYRTDNRRLLNVKASLPSGGYTFHNFNFTYDKVGNVTSLQNTALPPATNSIGGPETKTFVYDDLYRLMSSAGTHTIAAGATFTYNFSQAYDSIHNITHKTQSAMQNGAVNPQTTYDFAYTYPAPGSPHPHGPMAIGPYTITNDPDGNQVNTLGTGTSDQSEYVYDEENRLSCANKGPQVPTPACNAQGNTSFIYDHDGTRTVKTQSSPVIYPNQYYVDFGGGAGNQFKNVFIGSERILTKKARVAPDRQHWYYHTDHLHSTGTVTNENSQMVDAIHYFPFGEVWLEEVPASLPMDYFFTAKELDQETGFYDFGARYLDPRFSKWMTADPALGKYLPDAGKAVAYQSPSLNNNWRGHPDLPGLGGMFSPSNLALYGYGHQQPVTLVDPDGFAPKVPKAIIASLWGKAGKDAYDLARETTRLRNAKLAGTVHPITKVPFDIKGNPDFSKFLYKGVDDAGKAIRSDVNVGSLTGSRRMDEALANAEAGLKETPKGYRWHHHQDMGRMQLVEETVHEGTGHTGGFNFHQRALATVSALAVSIREASAQDWFNFVGETVADILTPPVLESSGAGGPGDTLYGPGTPFPTHEAYEDFQRRLQQAREGK